MPGNDLDTVPAPGDPSGDNAIRTLGPQSVSTVLRSPIERHSETMFASGPNAALDFLIASRIHRHDRELPLSTGHYLADNGVRFVARTDEEIVPAGRQVRLPESLPLTTSLAAAIAARRSVRDFGDEPMDVAALGTLLRAAGAITHRQQVPLHSGEVVDLAQRSVSSGGGLYPVELYAAAVNVRGLAEGMYRYAPKADALERTGGAETLAAFRAGVMKVETLPGLGRAAALLLLVGRPWRSMRKYGPRGMRMTLHEVGAIGQQAHLAAVALGLGSLDWTSFYDGEVNQALGFDGVRRAALHMILLGHPAPGGHAAPSPTA
ncbi:SagB/ThcOx family dehydrogenase [Spirillospora sp. CA-255316]